MWIREGEKNFTVMGGRSNNKGCLYKKKTETGKCKQEKKYPSIGEMQKQREFLQNVLKSKKEEEKMIFCREWQKTP